MKIQNSTFISDIKFGKIQIEALDVVMKNGKTYRYYDVPKNIFNKFTKSKSKGKFFTKHIKDNFIYEILN